MRQLLSQPIEKFNHLSLLLVVHHGPSQVYSLSHSSYLHQYICNFRLSVHPCELPVGPAHFWPTELCMLSTMSFSPSTTSTSILWLSSPAREFRPSHAFPSSLPISKGSNTSTSAISTQSIDQSRGPHRTNSPSQLRAGGGTSINSVQG